MLFGAAHGVNVEPLEYLRMPFPLAHPAAVLPLKRFCPRFLSFPALIVGSISPDAAYLVGTSRLSEFSHQWAGAVRFDLPAGLVLLGLFYGLARLLSPALPQEIRTGLQPVNPWSVRRTVTIAVSIVIGACTHILWDSFTHREGWVAQRIPVLEHPLATFGGHPVRIVHLLWYLSTVAGVAWILMALQNSLQPAGERAAGRSFWIRLRNALPVAGLMIPIGMVHHLAQHPAGDFIVVTFAGLVVLGFAWGISQPTR